MQSLNGAHVHLLLNHLPIVGTFFALALLAAASLRRSDELLRASLLAFVAVALLALPAYFSGERAEDVIEGRPGVIKDLIEQHEDAALPALIASEVLGLVALAGFVFWRPPRPRPGWLVPGALVLSLGTAGLMAPAGNFGGLIRHEELRPAAGSAGNPEIEPEAQ